MSEYIKVLAIYNSKGHNFRGHYGTSPGTHQIIEEKFAEFVAGKGIVGDRYFGFKEDSKCQVTFFDQAIHEKTLDEFKTGHSASAYRRNVLLSGVDLNTLIGKRFSIGKVVFEGIEECSPCYWLNGAIEPGVEDFLKGHGGLRAKVVQSGTLRVGCEEIEVL